MPGELRLPDGRVTDVFVAGPGDELRVGAVATVEEPNGDPLAGEIPERLEWSDAFGQRSTENLPTENLPTEGELPGIAPQALTHLAMIGAGAAVEKRA